MKTKLVSAMKYVKDLMDNPLPLNEINKLVDVYKSTGATHIDIPTVIGHPNFKSVSKLWGDAVHGKGLFVTWRCAHGNMEGLYGMTKYVGSLRKPTQFWIDEAVKAAKDLKDVIKSGDEWAVYPERTEGIFQDQTAFIWEGLPGSFGQFLIDVHDACDEFLPDGVTIGLTANNASELLSGWMPRSLSDTFNVIVIDHYRDGEPGKYDSEVRAISQKYGKPVYVQEGAPHRFTPPTREQCDEFYAVNKKMDEDGILYGFGSWSGWTGTPESIIDSVNGEYVLNEHGKSLQAWWGGVVPPEPPIPPDPTPDPPEDPTTVLEASGEVKLGKKQTWQWNLEVRKT